MPGSGELPAMRMSEAVQQLGQKLEKFGDRMDDRFGALASKVDDLGRAHAELSGDVRRATTDISDLKATVDGKDGVMATQAVHGEKLEAVSKALSELKPNRRKTVVAGSSIALAFATAVTALISQQLSKPDAQALQHMAQSPQQYGYPSQPATQSRERPAYKPAARPRGGPEKKVPVPPDDEERKPPPSKPARQPVAPMANNP